MLNLFIIYLVSILKKIIRWPQSTVDMLIDLGAKIVIEAQDSGMALDLLESNYIGNILDR